MGLEKPEKKVSMFQDLCFLGTASCYPSVTRSVSCLALRLSCGQTWIFDAGENTQVQVQKSIVKAANISRIFVTHLHGDHTFGLPGLMCLIGMAKPDSDQRHSAAPKADPPEGEHKRDPPPGSDHGNSPGAARQAEDSTHTPPVLELYGPKGLRMLLRASLRYSYSYAVPPYVVHELLDVPLLPCTPVDTEEGRADFESAKARLELPEMYLPLDARCGELEGGRDIKPNADGEYEIFHEAGITVCAAPLVHTVPCVGYVLKEDTKRGKLLPGQVIPHIKRNAEALKAHGIANPMSFLKQLVNITPDMVCTLPDGTDLTAANILGPSRPGRKLALCWDSADSSPMANIAQGCDILVHEATNCCLTDKDGTPEEVEATAVSHGHSTPQLAARFAERVGAQKLILTHFSPRYKGDNGPESVEIMRRIEQAAADALTHAVPVVAASDLLVIPFAKRSR